MKKMLKKAYYIICMTQTYFQILKNINIKKIEFDISKFWV